MAHFPSSIPLLFENLEPGPPRLWGVGYLEHVARRNEDSLRIVSSDSLGLYVGYLPSQTGIGFLSHLQIVFFANPNAPRANCFDIIRGVTDLLFVITLIKGLSPFLDYTLNLTPLL
jgi:hypothetical protein